MFGKVSFPEPYRQQNMAYIRDAQGLLLKMFGKKARIASFTAGTVKGLRTCHWVNVSLAIEDVFEFEAKFARLAQTTQATLDIELKKRAYQFHKYTEDHPSKYPKGYLDRVVKQEVWDWVAPSLVMFSCPKVVLEELRPANHLIDEDIKGGIKRYLQVHDHNWLDMVGWYYKTYYAITAQGLCHVHSLRANLGETISSYEGRLSCVAIHSEETIAQSVLIGARNAQLAVVMDEWRQLQLKGDDRTVREKRVEIRQISKRFYRAMEVFFVPSIALIRPTNRWLAKVAKQRETLLRCETEPQSWGRIRAAMKKFWDKK